MEQIHGGSVRDSSGKQDKFYSTWVRMRQRCNNKRNPDYKYYGKRGITICKRWDKFVNFRDDMLQTYRKHLDKHGCATIDRVDVNGNYSKKNCKWSTRFEQSNNRNYNRKITYNGVSKTAGEWAKKLKIGISRTQIYKRVFSRGWDVKRAFTQPYGEKFIVERWSIKHPSCIKCGTTKRRHNGFGLCLNCYQIDLRKRKLKCIN